MNLNSFQYSKERRQFGRQCLFNDRNELLFSIPQRGDLRYLYILRNPVNRGSQLSVQKAWSSAITDNVTLAHRGIVHTEGGWPKDVNILDEEQTLRHRKKVEREDAWGTQVVDISKTTTGCVLQNGGVNIYQDFFSEIEKITIRPPMKANPINLYHDPVVPKRTIVGIDWCPQNLSHMLSVHSNLDFFPTTDGPNNFFIWDIENPLKVILTFSAPTWVRKAHYCPRDETLIAGGFTDGKVAIWDARVGGKPVEQCPLEAAHREAVSALCWVHSKSNTEFYTGSGDGSVLYWDGRNMKTWYMQFLLDPERTDEQLRSRAHGCTALEFEYTIPIRYVVGDDMGHIFLGNRKGMTPMETLITNYKLFSGPIRTIERNPFFVRNFLLVGDWWAKIWSEECKDFPTTLIIKKGVQFMCGTWSTSRCSVFATGDINGVVDFWDLLLNQTVPIFSVDLMYTVTSLRFRRDGKVMAVALSNGDIHMVLLSKALRYSGAKEKALLAALFERESYRSKLLQDRVEELKLRRQLALEATKKDRPYGEDDDLFGAEEPNLEFEEEEDKDPDPEYTVIRNTFIQTIDQIREKWKEREFINEPSPFEGEIFEEKSPSLSIVAEEQENDE